MMMKKVLVFSGRLYFTKPKYIFEFASYGIYLRDVYLPVDEDGFQLVKDPGGDKYGANMIILGEKRNLFDVETIKYAISKGADLTRYCRNLYGEAMIHGAWELIKFLINEKLIDKLNMIRMYKNIYKNISFESFIDMLKYYKVQPNDLKKIINELFLNSCKGKSIDIVKYLVENGANIYYHNKESFFLTCNKNNIDTLKYLISINYGCGSISNKSIGNELLKNAIGKENINMIEYLLTICTDEIINNDLLIKAVKLDNLILIKYIVSSGHQINSKLYNKILDISFENNNNDKKPISLYLLSLNIKIDTHDKVKLFNKSCKNNCFQSAKFLFDEKKLESYTHLNRYVCHYQIIC